MKKKIHGRVSCHFLGRSRLDDFNKARVHMRTRALACGELREIALDALVQRSQRSASEGSTQTSNQYSILQIFIRRCFTIVARCCGRPYHPGDGHHFDRRKVTHLAVLRTKCWQMCVWGTGRYILMQRSDEGVITVWRRAKEVLLLRSRRFHCRGFYCLFFFFLEQREESLLSPQSFCSSTLTPLCQHHCPALSDRLNAYTVVFLLRILSLTAAWKFQQKHLWLIDWLNDWLSILEGSRGDWSSSQITAMVASRSQKLDLDSDIKKEDEEKKLILNKWTKSDLKLIYHLAASKKGIGYLSFYIMYCLAAQQHRSEHHACTCYIEWLVFLFHTTSLYDTRYHFHLWTPVDTSVSHAAGLSWMCLLAHCGPVTCHPLHEHT